jgi:hypothetical protein
LEEAIRVTRRRKIKFFKVQWSNHSEDEATWEREDYLRQEFPYLFKLLALESRDEILLRGEDSIKGERSITPHILWTN